MLTVSQEPDPPRRLPVVWRILEGVAEALFRRALGWRLEVEGLEHVPRDGGAVLAFNHHGYVDFVMAAWPIVRDLDREVRFLGKREVFDTPVLGRLARAVGAVPVDRGSVAGRSHAYDAAVAALAAGDLVAIAPEQTISQSFELLPFRTGAVRMARSADVPIVPVIGWGSHRLATKGRRPRPVRRIPVVVRYDRPFRVAAEDDPVEATGELQRRMAASLRAVQVAYGDPPRRGDDWWVPAALGGGAPRHEDVLRHHDERASGWREPDA